MGWVWFGVIVSIALLGYCIYAKIKEQEAESNYIDSARKIRAGMTKDDVISILGNDYTYSLLKNGIEKYEWRYRKNGYSYRVAKGVSMRQSGYTRRISVKFKDGIVVEINSLNMD
jgi:hypothetical protein